jgi:hypothetical protein
MNRVLKTQDKDPLSFSGKTEQEQIEEMKLFVSYIHKYRQRIFDKESTIFKQMVASLGVSFNKGENTEIESIDKLYKAFGRENVKKISELANKDDALCGIDALIILDGKENRAQIKPYTTVNYSGNEMEIVESAQVKEYGVELLVFWNKEKLLVFKNNETKIRNGNYVFDSKNLIFAFD